MVKVNHGWQAHSLDEVESLASHAVSPTSSADTVYHRHGDSASPRLPLSATQVHFAPDARRPSNSPPSLFTSGPGLAPPAPIRPSSSMQAPRPHARRNSNPRYTPTLLSHRESPHTPGQPPRLNTSQPRQGLVDPILFSPHQNVREQDAIETLLFMSSPGNSANLKHSFSPVGSPGPQSNVRNGARHALPTGPRKALPSQRPQLPQKKVNFDRSPAMLPPDSPMDLDSPQYSPNRGGRRRTNGGGHSRGALSLPSGLGSGVGVGKVLRDEDIERMLDGAGGESSDEEEITVPRRAGVLRA